MTDFENVILEQFLLADLTLSAEQAEKLSILTDFMLEYNKNINLTRITEPREIIQKHFIDSILPLTMVEVPRGTICADIGTGAGFPALPMKIYRSDLEFTLIDSLGKRIVYLNQVKDKLGLDFNTLHARSEEASKNPELREKFGFVTARAVASLNVLCEYCLPFVKKGGVFAAMKGADDETNSALGAVKKLGGEIEDIKKYCLPDGDKRSLIIIRKTNNTPEKYPRAGGVIAKKPL